MPIERHDPTIQQLGRGHLLTAEVVDHEDAVVGFHLQRRQVQAAEDDELQRIFILSNISEIAFDIKGMGGTFGYPLLTHLAKSLYDFVTKLGLPNEAQLEVISIHIDAMYVVLAHGVGGTDSQTEKELLDNLRVAVVKVQD